MAKTTNLQKLGIVVLLVSLVGGIVGTAYLSLAGPERSDTGGIAATGGQITNALLFTAGGIIGSLVGLVLFIVGRSRT